MRLYRGSPQARALVDLYEAGWSLREIEKMTGHPYRTVGDCLNREGVKMRPIRSNDHTRLVDHNMVQRVALLYDLGLSLRQVAAVVGCDFKTARKHVMRSGRQPRSKSEGLRLSHQWRGRELPRMLAA